ncbi:ISNCY family transposase [Alterisphingorhabdus coralli]|uniref:ISNCY family transposase n=1 Tax=Alterisphingorhabdus coralli TaxID=3071408 RepID=A0AA97F670_9SPHN|nr:ISNCY family transposase [Parasphingorhabdus sp. SCSIO 66989]WOE74033.1 ISNCY family transposase [Parasphingorhabdus sp. SCSIO 66989]
MPGDIEANQEDFVNVEEDYRVAAIEAYLAKQIRIMDLMATLGKSRSHVWRMISRYKSDGVKGLQSKKTGGNNRIDPNFRAKVVALVKEHYRDFTPQFASEKLLERHNIAVKPATLRRWMMKAGLWKQRCEIKPSVYSPRQRRERIGELIQVDGSYHRWFEKRGNEACLIVFIDDATSQIMHMRMVEHESSFNYMRCLKWYIEQYGRPLALYSDRHSIFRVNTPGNSSRQSPTQFSRACHELGIGVICASTPQAKGRVERSFRTQQDRLVKEFRLRGISTIEEANWFLEHYRQTHNTKFAKSPLDPEDAHGPQGSFNIDRLLTFTVTRKVFKDLTISFNKIRFILDDTPLARRVIGKRVTVAVYLDGRIEIFHDETTLAYKCFDKLRLIAQPAVVDRKRLGTALQMAKAIREVEPHHFIRNRHIMAGFRDFFPQPTDVKSRTLQNPTKTVRRKFNGRARAPLGRHPIVISDRTLNQEPPED